MEAERWIRAKWTNTEAGVRWQLYELTKAGQKQLAEEESRRQHVTPAVNRVLRIA
jgi:DNA-binding PadR family transcriptional regulator